MIGKIFNNRYQIVEKLGAGGTAIVYKGQDILLNRAVTIKILREEYASNNDFVRRFQREAQAVASLSHPNIVSVYDVGVEENMNYIVMEFVEGESLKEYIKRRGVLKLAEACNIITQILSGVQHAHEHGIIHRDIKPHNILLGKDGRAKVTDFGIAIGLSEVTMTYNASSRIMGSVHYISPEQVQGLPVTEKSDIYSAGVVFYEMLTGRLPFLGETPISIAMQHVQGELQLPHQLNPDVPAGVSYVVMRSMRKNPETRYTSAVEMSDAVRAAYEGSLEAASAVEVAPPRHTVNDPLLRYKDEDEDKRSGRKLNAGRIMLLAAAVVLLIGIVWFAGRMMNLLDGGNDKVSVPAVVGMSIDEAQQLLEDEGFIVTTLTKVSNAYAAGIVMDQSIAPEQQVSYGRDIELTVSEGPAKVTVPNLVGVTQRIAELTLSNMGLVPSTTIEFNEEFPKNEVMMQDPIAETEVAPGSTVQLLISGGTEPEDINMPNLLGKTREEATVIIDDCQLILISVSYAPSTEYHEGKVCAQSIEAGTPTQTGVELTITISEGPGPSAEEHVNFFLPQDTDDNGRPIEVFHDVGVVVNDAAGTREIFRQNLPGGSNIACSFVPNGSGTVTIYVDGAVVQNYPF